MSFKNIKISVKLFVSFLTASLLGILVFYFSFSFYTNAVDDLFYSNAIHDIISEEEIALWQFMSGDEQGEEKYVQAHKQTEGLKALFFEKYGMVPEKYSLFLRREQEIYEKFYGEENFFENMSLAKNGFFEKNNKHIMRTLGYMDLWARTETDKRIKVLGVLDLIRQERIYVDEFNPRNPDAEEIVSRFREANDAAVAGLVGLWQDELDLGLARASDAEMKSKIKELKKIVGRITATGFPPISEYEASLFGIEANKDTRLRNDAVEATRAVTVSCDSAFSAYESKGGKRLWKRADIADVGENVTPVFVLSKITSCQQGLRVNADDLFRLNFFLAADINPMLADIKKDIHELMETSSRFVLELVSPLKKSFFAASVVMITLFIFVWLFAFYFIIKPILKVRDAASEIAKGNMDIKIDTSGKDEIAKLAQALDKMRQSLKVVLEEYEKKLREKIKR